jgi:DNA ligase-4
VDVLRKVVDQMDPLQVKWLCSIILRDMKMGVSEKTILKEFHEDAEMVFNNCCDLRKARAPRRRAPLRGSSANRGADVQGCGPLLPQGPHPALRLRAGQAHPAAAGLVR